MFTRLNVQPHSLIAQACFLGSINDIKYLQKNGAVFDISKDFYSFESSLERRTKGCDLFSFPLIESINGLNVDVVEYLLKNNLVDLNIKDCDFKTPLYHLLSSELLKDKINGNKDAHEKAIKIFDLLIEYGAETFIVDSENIDMYSCVESGLDDQMSYLRGKPTNMSNLYSYACNNIPYDESVDVSFLHVDIISTNNIFSEPQSLRGKKEGNLIVLIALRNDYITLLNNPYLLNNNSVNKALFLSVQHNNYRFLETALEINPSLLKSVFLVSQIDTEYKSIFEHAIECGSEESLSILLKYADKYDYDWIDNRIEKLLAERYFHGEFGNIISDILIKEGVSPFKIISGGVPAFSNYVANHNLQLIETSLNEFTGQDLNLTDEAGLTCLCYAMDDSSYSVDTAINLIEHGADPFLKLSVVNGETTPFDMSKDHIMQKRILSHKLTSDEKINSPLHTNTLRM